MQVSLLSKVEKAPGGSDDDVGPGAQRLDLRFVGAPAVDRHHRQLAVADGQVFRGEGEVTVDLEAQFAGGHHDECAGSAGQRAFGIGGDGLKQRHTESQCLAHPGAGLSDEVVARHRQRQGQLLNGKCVFLAVLGQCAHYFVANPEFGKCWIEYSHTW